MGTAVAESIVHHYGTGEFLSRLSDPFWFQALGAVMGMDWHSSGITTSIMGALKRGLNVRAHELGLYICGGRGKQSTRTPAELTAVAERTGLDGTELVKASRLTARIDNNAVADGFQIYLHSFVVAADGSWTVVQQGLNDRSGLARRYHWHSCRVRDFVCEPHSGIVGRNEGIILNLVDRRAKPAQNALLRVASEHPDRTLRELPKLILPRHHDVREDDLDVKRLGAILAISYGRQLRDFASLLLLEKLGPRTLQTLAFVAEIIHCAPARFENPARFSFALGGKDAHPFPVPLKTYDETLGVLRRALDQAKLGHSDKLEGFRRLDGLVRTVEQKIKPVADFDRVLAQERLISSELGGRSVFSPAAAKPGKADAQLRLF